MAKEEEEEGLFKADAVNEEEEEEESFVDNQQESFIDNQQSFIDNQQVTERASDFGYTQSGTYAYV